MAAGLDPFIAAVARAPMLRLALPFVLGISVAMAWPLPIAWALLLTILATMVTVFLFFKRTTFDRRWIRGVAAAGWFLFFGVFWQVLRDPLTKPTHVSVDGAGELERIIRITAINGISATVVRADGLVLSASRAGETKERTGMIMLTLMRQEGRPDPIAGDDIVVQSRVVPITRIPDPGGFDRRAWAASRGMYHETFASPEQWGIVGHGWRWTDLFEPTRKRVSAWLEESGLPFRERALVKALVLGLRDELDHEQKDAFVKSGTIHVLAVSGTHVGFIYAMLVFMLGWWGGTARARVVRGIIVLLALWGYAGLTGACPSVLRATIMFTMFTLAGMVDRRHEALNSLFTAALLLLLWEPHMLIEIGFQLSFLAVLGIILFYGALQRMWIPYNKVVRYLWSLAAVSLAAQALTTPLSLYLFKAFPVWFLPANLIVVFVAGIAVYGAVALLVLFKVPILGALVVFLLSLLLTVIDRVTVFFAELPGAYPAFRINAFDMLLLYALVLLFAIRVFWKWRPAWRFAMVSVVLLLCSWGYHAHRANERVTFTVYDDRRALQAAMTVGRELTILAPDRDSITTWLDAKAERHARVLGLRHRAVIDGEALFGPQRNETGNTIAGGGSWSAPGLRVYFHHGGSDAPRTQRNDVLVLHDLRYLSEEDVEVLASGVDQVVLAGGLTWKLRAFVEQWCQARGIPCHDVRDQGAFVVERRIA